MGDPRDGSRLARNAMTLAAVLATAGSWFVLTLQEGEARKASPTDIPGLPPIPTLEPEPRATPANPVRRPTPVAVTRSSR
jgi:hypothetical protein